MLTIVQGGMLWLHGAAAAQLQVGKTRGGAALPARHRSHGLLHRSDRQRLERLSLAVICDGTLALLFQTARGLAQLA